MCLINRLLYTNCVWFVMKHQICCHEQQHQVFQSPSHIIHVFLVDNNLLFLILRVIYTFLSYLCIYVSYAVLPSIVKHPVTIQSVYPGQMVNFSCRAEGFSTLSYSWFKVESGSNIGVEIGNTTNPTYTISNPIYNRNSTSYYCVATNNEGIAVSNTSTLTGNYIVFLVLLRIFEV